MFPQKKHPQVLLDNRLNFSIIFKYMLGKITKTNDLLSKLQNILPRSSFLVKQEYRNVEMMYSGKLIAIYFIKN